MKRIKLFEAFNSIDKIKKVNFILFCWIIENFIKDNELETEQPQYISNRFGTKIDSQFASIICFNLRSTGRWFAYNPASEDLDVYCFGFINKYLVDNKIVGSYKDIPPEIIIYLSAKQVIKKMYEDEKNKTI
jgi:hypothetical protein